MGDFDGTRCAGHWRGQHRFRPRFSTIPPSSEQMRAMAGYSVLLDDDVIALTAQAYQCDVCERCGAVSRATPNPTEETK